AASPPARPRHHNTRGAGAGQPPHNTTAVEFCAAASFASAEDAAATAWNSFSADPAEENNVMTKVHAALDQSAQAHLSEVEAIAAIPAPSFEEHDRAVHVARRFREVGLSDVTIDEVDNVRGFLRGGAPHPHVLLAAHLDTVYPRDAHVPPRRSGSQLVGSSVRDNSPGVAALITLAAALQATGARPAGTLEFVSTSGEEGLGDL